MSSDFLDIGTVVKIIKDFREMDGISTISDDNVIRVSKVLCRNNISIYIHKYKESPFNCKIFTYDNKPLETYQSLISYINPTNKPVKILTIPFIDL
jgi:hypothetical protein